MRRAKIVCTLGPAVATPDGIRDLIAAGMNVARLNLSHGEYSDHEYNYTLVRDAAKDAGKAVAILADLQGPKIRLARFANGPVDLAVGDIFTITTEDVPGDKDECGTTYKGLPGDCKPGDRILVDDGKVGLEVVSVEGSRVKTRVTEGGRVSDNKGINLPGVAVSVPALSEKDMDDLRWALHQGVDMVALSFVRSAEDFADVERIMNEEGIRVPVIAKVEKPQAVDNLQEIVDVFDGIMVARGDLGVELPLEQVPLVQKRAIAMARAAAKPVIVATQMLESMITSSRPTRAEASDVANAVLDGADALMLSGETSVGEHPTNVVATMSRIIEHVESEALARIPALENHNRAETAEALCEAAVQVATNVDAKAIVAFTETGRSARLASRHRTSTPILAFTTSQTVCNQLALLWGTETFVAGNVQHTDEMVNQVDHTLLEIQRFNRGDKLVFIAGVPPGVPGTTNGMRVHKLGSGPSNT